MIPILKSPVDWFRVRFRVETWTESLSVSAPRRENRESEYRSWNKTLKTKLPVVMSGISNLTTHVSQEESQYVFEISTTSKTSFNNDQPP